MKPNETSRRNFLRAALTTSALVVAERSLSPFGHARTNRVVSSGLFSPLNEARRFAPVKVARDRIIRTVVGLRPFREEGFVVSGERLGDKLLVHNYGHGGAGVTLSWGTSSLAVDIAREHLQAAPQASSRILRGSKRRMPQRYAVLGCGVMGLSTARLLQRRLLADGATVTIYAKALPPQTTSNIAGALWYPTSVYDAEVATPTFLHQFRSASLLSNRAFQELVGDDYGVSWTDTYELMSREASLTQELPGGAHLYPQTQTQRDPDHYFGSPYARQFSTMMIEPHTYLRALLRDFYVAGGKVVVRDFKSREEVARLSETVVFNCTGLGARELFGDEKLGPVRGQLEVLLPQSEVDYCYLSARGYMFPRRDGIILGGTFDHDDWSLEPKAEQTTQILAGHTAIMDNLRS